MNITTVAPRADERADEYAERWRQWQLGNAKSSRRGATRARVVFAVVLTVATLWLALQILSSPVWL